MSEVNLRLRHASSECVEFFWNGRSLQGRKGESLAAALLASPLTLRNEGSAPIYQQLTISGYPQQAPAAGGIGLKSPTPRK